jgi:hypothetical protein
MSFFDDVEAYVDKVKRGTFGAVGAVTGSIVAWPTASLVAIAEVVQGSKTPQEALRHMPETCGSVIDGGEQFGRDHGPQIADFVWKMLESIAEQQARARARESEE